MSIDIGGAFREGFWRTFARNGLVLVGVFAAIALATTVLLETMTVALLEGVLGFFEGLSPEELEELGIPEEEHEQQVSELESLLADARESPFAIPGVPASLVAVGLLVTALLAEAASLIAIRVFASDETDTVPREFVTDNIVLATLNGFVGGIVVWALIIVGLVFFVVPGIILAVLFYFLRQEIALKDKNFIQAMADSWRITKGHRIEVFVIGLVLVLASRLEEASGFAVGLATSVGGSVTAAVVGGVLTAFGAAVVTRAYVQIDDETETEEEFEDPYAKALGPDDLPR